MQGRGNREIKVGAMWRGLALLAFPILVFEVKWSTDIHRYKERIFIMNC